MTEQQFKNATAKLLEEENHFDGTLNEKQTRKKPNDLKIQKAPKK